MNYLFFDIECADGKRMCSFGYVLVDEKFNIIDKKDILINPKCAFRLGRDEFNPNIELAYPISEFQKQKVFPCYYDEIKGLILNKDVMPIGHNVQSDMGFIKFACNRYSLDLIEYKAFDTQRAYALFSNSYNKKLQKIVEELDIDTSGLCEHKSCDDAEFTMRVAKKLCEIDSINIDELMAKYPQAIFELKHEDEEIVEEKKFGRVSRK